MFLRLRDELFRRSFWTVAPAQPRRRQKNAAVVAAFTEEGTAEAGVSLCHDWGWRCVKKSGRTAAGRTSGKTANKVNKR